VFETWSKLLHLVITQCNVVSNVTLVPCHVESFLELVFGIIELLFLEKHATLSHDGFT
jgi:hypothetical protein